MQRPKTQILDQFLGYPASHNYIANPPNCCTTVFFVFICIFIHSMTLTKYQKYTFGPKSGYLKIWVREAPPKEKH